ncbi:WD40-repeat-containing domain protein [Xylariales sp. PMI_506]|nr:WD40-repeat-containing domain protein [Xylariales sp. PMI_506]
MSNTMLAMKNLATNGAQPAAPDEGAVSLSHPEDSSAALASNPVSANGRPVSPPASLDGIAEHERRKVESPSTYGAEHRKLASTKLASSALGGRINRRASSPPAKPSSASGNTHTARLYFPLSRKGDTAIRQYGSRDLRDASPASSYPSLFSPLLSSPHSPHTRIYRCAESTGPGSLNQTPSNVGKKGLALLVRRETGGKEGRDGRESRGRSSPITPLEPAIDPLSQHIFVRTNTDRSIPSRLRTPGKADGPINEGLPRPSADISSKHLAAPADPSKDKKKTGSFLSRLSMIGNKKKDDDLKDDDSEISDLRTEGVNAVAFSSVAAGGYIPHHKEPPRYIRVRAHSKKTREFNRMFLAQELVGTEAPKPETDKSTAINGAPVQPVRGFGRKDTNTGGPLWAAEFSRDGKYLATAGRDQVVRVWAVISTPEDRTAYEEEESSAGHDGERLSAPVFHPRPIREFTGHTGEILDLSWSKNNFLLSSSMDKTVRLWHTSRQECLCTFKHKDFVTSIAFHPKDDRFFLAGSLDSTLRLWSIPDKSVAYSVQLSDLITAVAFSPDGKTSIAGCLNGQCSFYDTEGLKFQSQIHVRSSRGKNAKGSKITGIQTMMIPPDSLDGEVKVLVTSNDSRIRMYNLRDKALELKFKDHENTCNQIRASFSDDGSYIVCGSEDKKAFIWSTNPSQADTKDKRPCEYFEAHSTIVTQAFFAPTATRQLLQASHDPIFTLCNPPPVTLLSREEASASQTTLPKDGQPDVAVKVCKKPEETPAFIARSKHYDGNILVTTDHSGVIKVFRQDCAFVKRRHDNWENGSTFSRKLGRDGLLGRTGSVMTRTSAGSVRDPHSRRGSITQPPPGVILASPQMSSERIMSWRQGIEGTPGSRPHSIAITTTPARSERSVSPAKARTPIAVTNGAGLASEARRQPYASSLASPQLPPTSPTASSVKTDHESRPMVRQRDREKVKEKEKEKKDEEEERPQSPLQPPTPSFSFRSMDDDTDGGLRLDPAGASFSFWNLNRWRGLTNPLRGGSSSGPSSGSLEKGQQQQQHNRSASDAPGKLLVPPEPNAKRRRSLGARLTGAEDAAEKAEKEARRKSVAVLPDDDAHHDQHQPHHHSHHGHFLVPGSSGGRQPSIISTLTSEEPDEDEGGVTDDGEEMQCSKCGGHEFKAKKVGGRQRFLCADCGRMVDA